MGAARGLPRSEGGGGPAGPRTPSKAAEVGALVIGHPSSVVARHPSSVDQQSSLSQSVSTLRREGPQKRSSVSHQPSIINHQAITRHEKPACRHLEACGAAEEGEAGEPRGGAGRGPCDLGHLRVTTRADGGITGGEQ